MKDEEVRNGTSSKITEDGHCVKKEFTDNESLDKKRTYNPKINMNYYRLRYINTRIKI